MNKTSNTAAFGRRFARERVLGLLYEAEIKGISLEDASSELSLEQDDYAFRLLHSLQKNMPAIDEVIAEKIQNWLPERMSLVDRSLLRIGGCELMYMTDVPFAVVLDEAVELAKQYSSELSGSFVNGVLAAILKEEQTRKAQIPEK